MIKTAQKNAVRNIKLKFSQITFCLNERSRRIWAATEAKSYGWGGVSAVNKATGIDHKTIRKGIIELDSSDRLDGERIRKSGSGRKQLKEINTDLLDDLEQLVEPVSRGDPESPLRWTCKSTYKLADALKDKGYEVSQKSVYNLLVYLDYSMQSNRKTKEGANHPDRDKQFEYINNEAKKFQRRKCAVISVDTKKKEKIGNYKNWGREYSKKGNPQKVKIYDFIEKKSGKVAPYGVYDITQNKGWVSVGISSDTATFAVNTIRRWWYEMGCPLYSKSRGLLITADCGGSNGYRVRLWKVELQKLANEINKTIYVCHFPPGTSKWNKIEHRLFSYITKNWRGRPLIDKKTVVELIANTKTSKGLEVQSVIDETVYKKGTKITDEQLKILNVIPFKFHGEWNYKIVPKVIV